MNSITSLSQTTISPTTIDDSGETLIKSQRQTYSDTATAINKLIKAAKTIDKKVAALEAEVIPLNDLEDVTIADPADKQLLEYETSTGLWKNKTKNPSTVSFCFVYPTANQYSPFYKFKSDKTITGIDILAITAPTAAITVNVYRSDGTLVLSQSFTGQNSHFDVDHDVSTGQLYYAMISGVANSVNLMTVELTVVDR